MRCTNSWEVTDREVLCKIHQSENRISPEPAKSPTTRKISDYAEMITPGNYRSIVSILEINGAALSIKLEIKYDSIEFGSWCMYHRCKSGIPSHFPQKESCLYCSVPVFMLIRTTNICLQSQQFTS